MTIEDSKLYNGKQTFKLSASEGKVLMRIADGQLFGEEITLGYTYYLGGKKLAEPHFEVPSDYTEVDAPNEDEEPVIPEEIEIVDMTELGIVKRDKVKALEAYDKSDSVNLFYFNGVPMWVSLDKRVGLSKAVNDHEFLGLPEMTYTMDDGTQLTLPLAKWKYLLATVEIYAQECYNVTASHKAYIKALTSVEEIRAFDFTQGYPEKVHFEVEGDEEA